MATKAATKKAATPAKRDELLALRVTPAEKTKIEAMAKKRGLRVADYMRMELLQLAARGYY